ncbi:ROK family protein [Streptomyces sp. NPDC051561]|uniref:ROK family protein n=1 Tax=Streptomyces sp. NPDC051561 TaxID=3365658 RepID=UPI0037B8D97F
MTLPLPLPQHSPTPAGAASESGGRALVAAIDIGGTKIAGALVDSSGALLVRVQLPTPATEGAEVLIAQVHRVLDELRTHPAWSRVKGVGIGCAGPVNTAEGTVSPVNIPGWRGFPLAERVRGTVAGLPVRLIGDGPAVAAAEFWCGAARGRTNALCMVVSTGVGGGLVLDGKLYTGLSGNAGHIGHMSVDVEGEECPCGARGCVERLASGPSIVRYAVAHGWSPPAGTPATAQAVAEAARDGEAAPLAAFDRAARAVAASVAGTAALVELEVVVIGGGVARAGDLLFDRVRRELERYATLSFTRGVRVEPAETGTDAGLVGAAAVAFAAEAPAG